jgi:hypothetical protein
MPLDRAVKNKVSSYHLKRISKKDQSVFIKREREVRTYQRKRQDREIQGPRIVEEKASKISGPSKEKFSRSPIMDRSYKKKDRKKSPPRYRVPKPNPDVEPLEREYGFSRSRHRPRNWEDREQKPEEDMRQRSKDREQKSRKGGR